MMLEKAKKIYYMDDFRSFMREMQNLTDEDFDQPIHAIKSMILESRKINPMELFFNIFESIGEHWIPKKPVPVNNHWHHFIVPGSILTSMRNNGYDITNDDIKEGMIRGQKLSGGSCGFMGMCGGAYSVGIIASIVNKTNPLHDEKRSHIFRIVSNVLIEISEIGMRCCKRSSYIAIRNSVDYLSTIGYPLPLDKIECRFLQKNPLCYGKSCPYHPKTNAAD